MPLDRLVSDTPAVDRAGCSMRAMPKSRILARPSLVRKMLSGLMSRWMMPFACAAARPSAIWQAISTAFCGCERAGAQPFGERLALEQLRDRVGHGAEGARVVDREDVRVIERRDGARLAVEAARGCRRRAPPRPGSIFRATSRRSRVSRAR